MPQTVTRTAVVVDGYRYRLAQDWGDNAGVATWIMLNPSTADALRDDATIRRCRAFSQAFGCSGLVVVNLYGYRATKPADLWQADDPIGPLNDHYLAEAIAHSARNNTPLIAAWGAHAKPDRVADVLTLPGMHRLQALATTASGQPAHPLRLSKTLTPFPWAARQP